MGVMIAVSLGVKTRAVLPMRLNGALKFGPPLSTACAYNVLYISTTGKPYR
ncbi:hypothetical protein D3C76_1845650 [compost metagenome]